MAAREDFPVGEQVRRDAEERIREQIGLYVPAGFRDEDGVWNAGPHRANGLRALDALLAELKQAERRIEQLEAKHDDAVRRGVEARRERDEALRQAPADWNELENRRLNAEARLASVPALVEALRDAIRKPNGTIPSAWYWKLPTRIHDALTVYEQSQGNTE